MIGTCLEYSVLKDNALWNDLTMMPKCLKCSNRLSLSWLTVSFDKTKYRCVKCGALHEFTYKHKILELLFIIPIILLTDLSQSIIAWDTLRLVVVLFIGIVLFIFIPGQYRLSSNDDLEIKNRV